jgi:hypothetical protein
LTIYRVAYFPLKVKLPNTFAVKARIKLESHG